MKLTRLLPFVAAATLLLPAGVAAAQEATPTCGEALSVLVDARAALDALPDTIPNPALPGLDDAVLKAQASVAAATTALNAAQATANDVETNGSTRDNDRAAIVARIADLKAFIAADSANPADQIALAEKQLAARKAQLAAIDELAAATAALKAAQGAREAAPATVPNPALTSGPTFDAAVAAQNTADVACQGQPGDPGPVDDRDCADFESQADAQAVLDADDTDPNKLDADGDRIACELDEAEDKAEPTPVVIDDAEFGQVGEVPVGSVDTGRA